MGRGLSQKQQNVLVLALEKRRDDPDRNVDLYCAEMLHHLWGFPYKFGRREFGHGQNFDQDQIGRRPYRSARASLSRSLRRLEDRGLVERYDGVSAKWVGIELTSAGEDVASGLSVNTAENLPKC